MPSHFAPEPSALFLAQGYEFMAALHIHLIKTDAEKHERNI